MDIVGDCLVGLALEALSFGFEQLIGNNAKFKSLSADIKSKLDTLRPIIHDMVQCNEQSNFPEDPELRDLQVVMEKGAELVDKCSKLPIWRVNKKFKYTNRLCDWNESLEKQLSLLKLRGLVASTSMLHDIRSAVVKRNQPAEVLCAVPELPKVTVGLEVPLQELKAELLKDEVAMLVVTAPRGCGKTTLVTNFCQDPEVKDKFKNNIFFVTVSRKPNLELIMKELYGRKGYQVPTFRVDEAYVYKWLQKVIEEEGDNPLLLVLDDVWSGSEYFLEKFEFKLSNYKVLVTARCDLRRFGSSYLLPLLDDHNAMKLFHHTASLGDKSSHIPKYISKEIVNHCNGFPLAITVVGRSLCAQPIEMWQSRLSKWSEEFSILDSETELLLRLQSSIDAIDDEIIKKCFLDLGSFSEDSLIPIAVLIDMWAELYDLDEDSSCVAILYELRNRSLVSLVDKRIIKVDGDGDYSCFFVKQHDLLRELAIYQSKQNCIEHRERVLLEMCGDNLPKWWNDNKSPIKARLLSISTDGEFSVKLPNMDFPQVEILVLNFRTQNYALPVFVKEMKELKVLVVQNTGTSFTTPVNDFHMLGALLNLRRIRLDSISLSCITENPTELESVQKLSLRHCVNFADGFQKISYTFPNLMEIYIDMCFMEKLPAELGNLIHLIKLSICAASELSLLPKEIGKLVNLEVLKVRSCMRLLAIPESIGDLNKLVFLDICACVSMKKLPENLCKLMSLRKLKITACYELSVLPKGLGNLVNLEVLSLRWCTELLQLPVSITNLKKLNTLDIHDCRKLEELPEHIGNLTSLRSLDMSRCMKMLKLPQSVSNLDQLEEVICEPFDAKVLWPPFLPDFKNLGIVEWKQN